MHIGIHPKNLVFKSEIERKAEKLLRKQGLRTISGFTILIDKDIPETISKEHKLIEYERSDWEVYFGFVPKEPDPYFCLLEPGYSTHNNGKEIFRRNLEFREVYNNAVDSSKQRIGRSKKTKGIPTKKRHEGCYVVNRPFIGVRKN